MYRDYIYVIFLALSLFFSLCLFLPKLAPCCATAQRMKDCVPLLCLAITMTPRLNHVKSSDILAVVEMPTTLSLKWIATMSVEMVRVYFVVVCFCCWLVFFFFVKFFSHKQSTYQQQVFIVFFYSPWLATGVCCLHFGLLRFQGLGKLKGNAKSFWQDQCDVRWLHHI